MKAKYNKKTVYVKCVSEDRKYVLVSYDKSKPIGLFKVNITDLEDVNITDLK